MTRYRKVVFQMYILAELLFLWVFATTLDLLPNLPNKHTETCEENVPPRLPVRDSFRGQQFNVAFAESTLDYAWVNKEGKKMYDGPVSKFLQTLESTRGIIIHKKPAATHDKLLNALMTGEIDFTVSFLYFPIERMTMLDSTAAVASGVMCLVMKRAPFFSFGMVLLLPYQSATWVGLLLSLCALAVVWHVVQGFRMVRGRYIKNSSDGSKMHAVLDVVQVLLTNSCTRVARTNAQRVVLTIVLLFVLVMSNAYSGQLLGLLANPPRLKDPQTLQEAARVVQTVYLAKSLKAAVIRANVKGSLTELINKSTKRKNNLHSVLRRIAKDGKESVLTNSRQYLYFAYYKEFMDKGGRALHNVPECFFAPGHQYLLIRKNSTFYDVLNKVALWTREGGLFDYWSRLQRHRMDANGVTVPAGSSLHRPHPLSLEQLSGSFTVLSIAWIVATLIFALELVWP